MPASTDTDNHSMKHHLLRSLLILALFLFSQLGFAAECPQNFAAIPPEHVEKLIKRYPEFEAVLKDPAAFKAEMNRRFLAAKAKDPAHALDFDFSELSMPTLKSMAEMVPGKLAELDKMKELLREEGRIPFWLPKSMAALVPKSKRLELGRKMIADIEVGQQYIRDLAAEVDAALKAGKINYGQMVELSHFFARGIGYFDRYAFDYKYKLLMLSEYKIQGYRDLPIQEEYKMYKDRDHFLFQMDSKNESTKVGSKLLEKAYANRDELETILVPTPLHLNLDVFYHLQPHYIYPIGVSDMPIGADGVLRHGGLFYAHDMGHSGIMMDGMKPYFKDIDKLDVPKVTKQMETWYGEFLKELNKVENKELRHAIRHLAFNIHHERGYPLAPSTYDGLTKPPGTTYLLFLLFEMSGQTPGMGKKAYSKIPEAFRWIQDFWKVRKEEEARMLGKAVSQ